MNQKFEYGNLLMTYNAACATSNSPKFVDFVAQSFLRYVSGDWGEVTEAEKQHNDWALINNDSIKGVYTSPEGIPLCFITEGDRSRTRIIVREVRDA